jgi:hypothetical protein
MAFYQEVIVLGDVQDYFIGDVLTGPSWDIVDDCWALIQNSVEVGVQSALRSFAIVGVDLQRRIHSHLTSNPDDD